ncbi:unnamed protein product, partial [Durusdinium trenchii]
AEKAKNLTGKHLLLTATMRCVLSLLCATLALLGAATHAGDEGLNPLPAVATGEEVQVPGKPDETNPTGGEDVDSGLCSSPSVAEGAATHAGDEGAAGLEPQPAMTTGEAVQVPGKPDETNPTGGEDVDSGLCSSPSVAEGAATHAGDEGAAGLEPQPAVTTGEAVEVPGNSDETNPAGGEDVDSGLNPSPSAAEGHANDQAAEEELTLSEDEGDEEMAAGPNEDGSEAGDFWASLGVEEEGVPAAKPKSGTKEEAVCGGL